MQTAGRRLSGQRDRDALRAAIELHKVSLRKLAAEAGISDGTLRAFLEGKTKSLQMETAARIAQALGTTWDQIVGYMPGDAPGAQRALQVPVYATSVADDDHFTIARDRPPAEVYKPAPMPLAARPRAFAVRLPGYSYSPRFRAGEMLVADPDRAPMIGDDVLAILETKTNSGQLAVIGTLVAGSHEGITLHVPGRERTLTIPHARIESLCYLLHRADLLGV